MKESQLVARFIQFLYEKRNTISEKSLYYRIVKFPEYISEAEYRSITKLSLNNYGSPYKLTKVPDALLKCINLVSLDLGYNSIISIKNLENCKKLKNLFLYYNSIYYINTLDYLPDLEYCLIHDNKMSTLDILELQEKYPDIVFK